MKTNSLILAAEILLVMMSKASGQSPSIVQFASPSYAVNENRGTVTLVVERIGDPGAMAYVEYATFDRAATHGEDYVEQTGFLQFIGETNLTIVIPILNDAVMERDEIFIVSLRNPDPVDTKLGAVTDAVVTILYNDQGVEFSTSSFTVDEGAGQAMITVRGGTDSTNGFSVEYATTDGCSAIASVDYLAQGGTLTFAAGETEKTFLIPIIDDTVAEGDETVNLRLSHPSGVALGPISNAVLRIRDNDPPSDLAEEIVPRRVGMWSSVAGGASAIAVAGNYAYLGAATFEVLDISDPANPRRVGECSNVSGISDLVVSGNYGYAAVGLDPYSSTGSVQVIDISDPTHPIRVGRYGTSSSAVAISVSGQYGYVAVGTNGLDVLDLSNPANPRRVGHYADSSRVGFAVATGVAVSGNVVYVAYAYAGLHVLDVSDPANPRRIGGYSPQGLYSYPKVIVSGNYAYLLGDSLRVVDVTNPANPQEVGQYYLWTGDPKEVVLIGGLAYVAVRDWLEGNGLVILDLTQPLVPRLLRGGYLTGQSSGVAVSGSHAYVTGDWGLDVLDIRAPTNVARVGGFTAISSPNEVAVSGNYVYVADAQAGLVIIDVTDPANPRLAGRAGTRGPAVGVAISCDHAIVASQWGVSVFDISQPSSPQRVDAYDQFGPTAIAVQGNWAYCSSQANWNEGGVNGLLVIDIGDPSQPQLLGVYDSFPFSPASDVVVSGDFAYLATGHLQSIDINDPSHPQKVGESRDLIIGYSPGLAVSGSFVYLTAYGWLSVLDVGDPARPEQVGSNIPIGGDNEIGHSRLAVAGGRLCVAESAGLELFDIRDPANPRQTAFYVTHTNATAVAISGDFAFVASSTRLEIIDLNPLGFRPGSITRLADGQVQFVLNTRPGGSYTVQASTNLVDWATLETRTAADTKLTYIDTNAPNFFHRFYRAVSH